MAQCKQTPQEFIKNSFTPQIAVLCTNAANNCCKKNNLNFVELFQPFSKLNNDVHYKDSTNATITIHNLKLTFSDLLAEPPASALARKYLNASVSESVDNRIQLFRTNDYKLSITLCTPWFQAWRKTFLRVQSPSDHEYTKHFLACVLILSSSDDNPQETINNMTKQVNQSQIDSNTPGKLPKWFSANVLTYYVVVHDNTTDNNNVTNSVYEAVKTAYGESNCFLLRINSRTAGHNNNEHLPDPWSQFIIDEITNPSMHRNNKSPSGSETSTNSSTPSVTDHIDRETSLNVIKTNLNYHPLSPDDSNSIDDRLNDDPDKLSEKSVAKIHGQYLSTEDIEQIKLLIYEFAQDCLLPYIERQIQNLNDSISNKKGMSRSLFSATKRWFNPNKPGTNSIAINHLIYAPDSHELQIRRLADLYFMFGNYSGAFQSYHLAKRDYNTDQAWLYYAGALEMASLSAFMANESTRKTCDYMEESITTYLNTCKMPQFATRATLLSTEYLKSQKMYGEAAHQFIRMTSEESDLRSALFLEQAAYCFLHTKMIRKYAFHMVLAGHRFSKAAQRKHSLRSYKQAYQIYQNSGWNLSEDHIHYTIGRQAHSLHYFDEAVDSFSQLLKGNSRQSPQQQSLFLKEYLTILGSKVERENASEIPILPLPGLNTSLLKLLMGPTAPLTTPGKVTATGMNFHSNELISEKNWNKLEELLVYEAQGYLPVTFTPMITLYTFNNLPKISNPIAIVNEQIQVCIHLVNSLQIVLNMKDIYLLWIFKDQTKTISNEHYYDNNNLYETVMKTHITKSTLIQGNSDQNVILSLTPLVVGQIIIIGICYVLFSSDTNDTIFIKGKQLFDNNSLVVKTAKQAVIIDGNADTSKTKALQINIIPAAPCLQVLFSEINSDFLCDEIQKVNIDFLNIGSVPLHKVRIATSVPHLLNSYIGGNDDDDDNNHSKRINDTNSNNKTISITLPNNRLDPGEFTTYPVWIKAPNTPGPCVIDLLIYYECTHHSGQSKARYRLVRHYWNLSVKESVSISLSTQTSYHSKQVEELSLAVKVGNMNKIHSTIPTIITLLNIGVLSKYWTLIEKNLVPAASSECINLYSQESTHILLKAKRNKQHQRNYSSVILNTDTITGNKQMKKQQQLTMSLKSKVNHAFVAFAVKMRSNNDNFLITQSTSDNFDNNTATNNNSIIGDDGDGVLLLQWQALVNDSDRKRLVNGQSHIPISIQRFNNSDNSLDSDVSLIMQNTLFSIFNNDNDNDKIVQNNNDLMINNKIMYNFVHPAMIEHNFTKNRLCIVNVTLLIHSVVRDVTLNVIVNTLGQISDNIISQSGGDLVSLIDPRASKSFSWLGTGRIIKVLPPLSTVPVQLSVVVTQPGTFDLGTRLQILCNIVGGQLEECSDGMCQFGQPQSILIVVNS